MRSENISEPEVLLLHIKIRIARRHARMSQNDLAQAVGVSRGAVANWERVKGGSPATHNLARIARLTHVNHEWLSTGRGAMLYSTIEVDVPALDVDLVFELDERELLSFYRAMKAPFRRELVAIAASYSSK